MADGQDVGVNGVNLHMETHGSSEPSSSPLEPSGEATVENINTWGNSEINMR